MIKPALVEPYCAFQEPFYGEFEDDPDDLVHIQESEKEFPDKANRSGAAGYLNRPWKQFDKVELVGFYPNERNGQILLHDAGVKRRRSLEHFVRGHLVDPLDSWLRRDAKGFLHGTSNLSKLMDFAAK